MFNELEFTDKWKAVIKSNAKVVFLEGVTGSGKSILSIVKFMYHVLETDSPVFFLIGESIGALERNVINSRIGFKSLYGPLISYRPKGEGGAHIEINGTGKSIYLTSYSDKSAWKKVLGSTSGGFFIDEINNAHEDFLGEVFTRLARDDSFILATSNGDEASKLFYTRYLDRCNPYTGFENDIPPETMNIYNKRKDINPEWEYYFFGFKDNPTYTEEQIQSLYNVHPVGSWQYNTKILGIRSAREGVIYANYMDWSKLYIPKFEVDEMLGNGRLEKATVGIDVGATDSMVFTFRIFTKGFRKSITYSYKEFNNADHDKIWSEFVNWFTPLYVKYGRIIYGIFIDNAAKILLLTFKSRSMKQFGVQSVGAYKYTIKERVDMGISWFSQGRLLFTNEAKPIYNAYTKPTYTKDREKTDCREWPQHIFKDMVDSDEYALSPFVKRMTRS